MLFVAYGVNNSVLIREPLVRKIADQNGNLQTITDRPMFNADFKAARMTETQRVIAKRAFIERNPKAPFGATPYSESDIMGGEFSIDEVVPGTMYTGFDPAFALCRFDTREDIPYEEQGALTDEERAELKAFTEKTLLRPEKGFGTNHIRVDDSLPKPWPAYPLEQAAGVAQKILADAKTVGVTLESVLEFERTQDAPRKGVLSLLEAEIQREREEAAEQDALGAQIPA